MYVYMFISVSSLGKKQCASCKVDSFLRMRHLMD